jgi:hypothetical protein
LGKNLKKLRSLIWLLVFVLILFVPMIVEFIYIEDFALIVQRILSFWRNRSTTLVLSDMLFLQGGVLILFGALVAGVILYNAWGTTRLLFRKYISSIWNTKVMEQERRSPTGLLVGLILIGAGIAYILVGIIITI